MKPKVTLLFVMSFVLSIGIVSTQLIAQTVNVKMRVNTSTCLDTLRANHFVQVQGESKLGTTPAITWNSSSGIVCTNIGGDYWEANFKATAGDTIKFKFVTGFDATHPTFHWSGYEGPLNAGVSFSTGDNRIFIVGKTDTSLPLQYFNGWESKLDQYWKPFLTKKDTIAVYFRVNMGGVIQSGRFNPATQGPIAVRGGSPLNWDTTKVTLLKEVNSINGGSFYSGVAYIPKSALKANNTQEYKFFIENFTSTADAWETSSNRSFKYSANLINTTGDTTIYWNYFENKQPMSGNQVTGNINFRLKLNALEKVGLFNRGLGDKVVVIGAKGWTLPDNQISMTYVPSLQEWVGQEPFTLFPTTQIIYKYYIYFDSTKVDTANSHYIPGLRLTDGWEEPGVTGGANRTYAFQNAADQTPAGDFGSVQQFFNSLHPNGVITTPMKVTFNIDMAPAANVTTNPTNALFRPGLDTVSIQFDGCFVSVLQGKSMYGTDNRLILTDPDGDGKYSGSLDLVIPSLYQLCYRVVYSSPGGEVSNGGGVETGRRYYQYITPTKIAAGGVVTWPSTYNLATMPWKATNLTVETPPDMDKVTAVENETLPVPDTYSLMQNYPNPFNPSTVITYSIPENVKVNLEVYNVLGQKVASLFNQEQTAGTHSVVWNSKDDKGFNLSTGIYLIKMQAGKFSSVKKMMLVK